MNLVNETDESLVNLARTLFNYIEDGCFGTRDLQLYETVCRILRERGWEVKEAPKLIVKKGNDGR